MSDLKIFETRDEMITIVPKNGVIAELGVFKGEFSKKIDEICQPKELVLIDIWVGDRVYSGDVDGNHKNGNKEYYTADQVYKIALENTKNCKSTIRIIKDTTEVLKTFEDNTFDMIYIDADHSYNGVKKDLEMSIKKVKNGGYIMGHDYEQNFDKTNNVYNHGVKKAVDEFCEKYGQEVFCKGMDGCVSYGILIRK